MHFLTLICWFYHHCLCCVSSKPETDDINYIISYFPKFNPIFTGSVNPVLIFTSIKLPPALEVNICDHWFQILILLIKWPVLSSHLSLDVILPSPLSVFFDRFDCKCPVPDWKHTWKAYSPQYDAARTWTRISCRENLTLTPLRYRSAVNIERACNHAQILNAQILVPVCI